MGGRRESFGVLLAVAVGTTLTVASLQLLARRMLPLGLAGEWQWQWRPVLTPLSGSVAAALAAVLACATFLLDAVRQQKVRSRGLVFAVPLLALASYALPLQLLSTEPGGWKRAIVAVCSDPSMGYMTEAVKTKDLRQWLRDVRHRTDAALVPGRVATHPPGPVVFYRILTNLMVDCATCRRLAQAMWVRKIGSSDETLTTARRVCSAPLTQLHVHVAHLSVYLLTLGVPLTVLGVWAVGRVQMTGREATTGAVLASTIPALHGFVPSIDTYAAAVAVWCVALWSHGLRRNSVLAAFAAGLVWGAGLMWTFGLAALIVPLALDAVYCRPRKIGQLVAALVVGVTVSHLPLMLMGYNPLASFLASMETQRGLMRVRSYLPWVGLNAWDFSLFAGLPLIALAVAALGCEGRKAALPAFCTLALLLLSGSTRGEVGRIWCFLMPLMAVPAAQSLCTLREFSFVVSGTLVVCAQLATTVGLSSYLLLVSI